MIIYMHLFSVNVYVFIPMMFFMFQIVLMYIYLLL